MKIEVSRLELVWIIAALRHLAKTFDRTWGDDDWVIVRKAHKTMPTLLELARNARPRLGSLIFRLQKEKESNDE